mmetsp:Transcript_3227/g.5016  ORF Transcript_3227/g.5016 Transcript_3227/m.5016 type:complete len:100 (-) Transcript_3227:162-461(-)
MHEQHIRPGNFYGTNLHQDSCLGVSSRNSLYPICTGGDGIDDNETHTHGYGWSLDFGIISSIVVDGDCTRGCGMGLICGLRSALRLSWRIRVLYFLISG